MMSDEHFTDTSGSKKFSDSSVKRIDLFILPIVPDFKECYQNVKSVFDLLKIENLRGKYTMAMDLKMINIRSHWNSSTWKHSPLCIL